MSQTEREARAVEERVGNLVLEMPETSFLRQYVIYAAQLTDCNAIFHLGAGLVVLAQTVQDDMYFRLGNRLPANLFALAVGVSTESRKSSSVQIARELLEAALPGQTGKTPGSYQGLIDSLVKKPRQALFYSEFGRFLAESQHSYLTPIKTVLTDIYDGTPVGRELVEGKKKGAQEARKPRLSIFGGCTPGFLSRYTEPTDWTDGFFARFLVFRAERYRFYEIPRQSADGRDELIQALKDRFSCPTWPECLGLEEAALPIWRQWIALCKDRAARAPRHISSIVSRAQGHVAKIALNLAWDFGEARNGGPWWVTSRHLSIATQIVALHLDSVFALGEEIGGTLWMNDRLAVLLAVKERATLLGELITASRLPEKRVREVLGSMLEEKVIETVSVVDETGTTITAYQKVTRPNRGLLIPLREIQPPPSPPLLGSLSDGPKSAAPRPLPPPLLDGNGEENESGS